MASDRPDPTATPGEGRPLTDEEWIDTFRAQYVPKMQEILRAVEYVLDFTRDSGCSACMNTYAVLARAVMPPTSIPRPERSTDD